jgi:DeoR family ulaG and ulaABCDEF operon transcriptional repressor
MSQAEKIIVMADHTKFKNRESFILCPLNRIDCVITDNKVDDASISMLENQGVELIIV